MQHPQDPVTPHTTFDNYVVPESVRSPAYRVGMPPAEDGFRFHRVLIVMVVIAIATFALGVLATLKVMGPGETLAEMPAPVEETVTRLQTPDLITPVAPVPDVELPLLRAAVLQGLQPRRTVGKLTADEVVEKAQEAQEIISRNKMRMLREGVLAGVYTVKASMEGDQRRLVLTTVNAEMTRAAMRNLLRTAAEEQRITIPPSLSTAEGAVDLDTMLFHLVQVSLATDGTPEGLEAATEMSRRAFAASDAKTQTVDGARIYVVEPGDSLAYISLQFYGRPNAYLRIFEANREKLRSPDLIQVGQRLIIPS